MCSHRTVKLQQERLPDGSMWAWWQCRGCGRRFIPEPLVEREPSPLPPPDKLAIDANGFGWRVYPGHWSMIPTNPDNSPIPQPVTMYDRRGSEQEASE